MEEYIQRQEELPLQSGSQSAASNIGGMVMTGAGVGLGFALVGVMLSDVRLKHSVKRIGCSQSGIPIHRFGYVGDASGAVFEGALAQEVALTHPEAVVETESGFYAVNYEMLDVNMRRL